jgi:hypothetical protein
MEDIGLNSAKVVEPTQHTTFKYWFKSLAMEIPTFQSANTAPSVDMEIIDGVLKSSLVDAIQTRWRSRVGPISDDEDANDEGQEADSAVILRPKGYHRLAIVLAVVVILLVVFQYLGLGTTRRLGLVAKPEAFTELYFSHANALPSVLTPKDRSKVEFTLSNHEGTRRVYDWTADFNRNTAKIRLANGSVSVRNLDSRTITLDLPPKGVTGSGIIEVSLKSPHQTIDFRVTIVSNGSTLSKKTK